MVVVVAVVQTYIKEVGCKEQTPIYAADGLSCGRTGQRRKKIVQTSYSGISPAGSKGKFRVA